MLLRKQIFKKKREHKAKGLGLPKLKKKYLKKYSKKITALKYSKKEMHSLKYSKKYS